MVGLLMLFATGLATPPRAAPPGDGRIDVPEGWIEVQPSGKQAEEPGTVTVVPAPRPAAAEPAPPPPPNEATVATERPASGRRSERCRPLEERFLARMAVLHQIGTDGEPLSPELRRRLYDLPNGGGWFGDRNQPPVEITWDGELRDLFIAYNRCLRASASR